MNCFSSSCKKFSFIGLREIRHGSDDVNRFRDQHFISIYSAPVNLYMSGFIRLIIASSMNEKINWMRCQSHRLRRFQKRKTRNQSENRSTAIVDRTRKCDKRGGEATSRMTALPKGTLIHSCFDLIIDIDTSFCRSSYDHHHH